jgi:hypothetical protein
MGEALFGPQFIPADMDAKIEALARAFHERRFLIIWDNFESAIGVPGTSVAPNLPDADCQLLARFLGRLRDAPTKVILTSRSPEGWLGVENRYLLRLGGLEGEERWDYCMAILSDLGLRIDRNDPDLAELMTQLGGHPLTMRVILPRLAERPAAQVVEALRSNLSALGPAEDEAQALLYATLRFAQESLSADLQPLLIPLAMHEGFVDTNLLDSMAEQVDTQWTRTLIDRMTAALVAAGQLRARNEVTYEMHPVLTGFLRSTLLPTVAGEARDVWARAFVLIMASVADALAPRELHQQR